MTPTSLVVVGWVPILSVFARPTRILSMSDILENFCSILDIRLSRVVHDRVNFSQTSITGVLDNPTTLIVVSLTVLEVDIV